MSRTASVMALIDCTVIVTLFKFNGAIVVGRDCSRINWTPLCPDVKRR